MRMRLSSRIGFLWGLAFVAFVALASAAHADTKQVGARENLFVPQEVRIDPGDRIVWTNNGIRDHTVTADDRAYDSGPIDPGDKFARTYRKEGYYFYHCKLHGSVRSGMWGVVVVGDPGPPGGRRPKLVVPDKFRTIQKAVLAAQPGSTIVVKPGRYSQEIEVSIPDLVIRGVDRFRTIIDGGDTKTNGITVDGFGEVTVKNLTIRNFTGSGIALNDVVDYTVSGVDLIKNRTFGVNAVGSNEGVIRHSFGWGSGDSAFRIAGCTSCSTLVDDVEGKKSFIGLTLENVFGVVVRDSHFAMNGAGVVSMSTLDDPLGNHGAHLVGNSLNNNNYSTVPEAGLSSHSGLPFGTGIWLAGAAANVVESNSVGGHDRYGILVTRGPDAQVIADGNEVIHNSVSGSGLYDLAWDGYGEDNCFDDNVIGGATGPSDIPTTYACSARPFTGTPFDPVIDEVAAALVFDPNRPQSEPPEPHRPRCQGC
jgi:plastocyanin